MERALELFSQDRERRGYMPNTLRLETRVLRALLRRLPLSLRKTRHVHVEALFARRVREVAPNTCAREASVLTQFFAFLLERGLVQRNPAERLAFRHSSASVGPRRVLKSESVARLLDLASIPSDSRRSPEICRALSLRNRAALELLYGLGVRRAEVSRARVGDLDQEQAMFLVRRVKRGAHQHVPVPTASMPHLLAYLAEGRPFLAWNREDRGRFLVTERGTPVSADRLSGIVAELARQAGLRCGPHVLRRSVATHLVDEGANLVAVQRFLGHRRLTTTQRYVLVSRAALRRAVSVLERVCTDVAE